MPWLEIHVGHRQIPRQFASEKRGTFMAVVGQDPEARLVLDREKLEIIEATFLNRQAMIRGKTAEVQTRNLTENQPAMHKRIADLIANLANHSRQKTVAKEFAQNFQRFTERAGAGVRLSASKRTDSEYEISSEVPVLLPEAVETLVDALIYVPARMSANPKFIDDAIASLAVSYLAAFVRPDQTFDLTAYGPFSFNFQRALARSEIFALDREAEGQTNQRSERLFALQDELTKKYVGLESESTGLTIKLEALSKNANDLTAKISAATNDIGNLDGKTAAAYQTLIESIGLKETDNLWRGEARRAKREYYLSFGVLVVILLAIPIAIALSSFSIFSVVSAIEESAVKLAQNNQNIAATASVFSRILLLTIPIGFVIWAIKIGVRYNVRSMLLMDDANHRVAMLNTYLFLIKQNAATVQDRGAVLEALFRRTPGHGPDTVEAPNLTDLMKYGQQVDKA